MRRAFLFIFLIAGLQFLGGCGSSNKNSGTHVYVVNNSAGNVGIYSIQGDGTLAVSNGSPFSVGANALCLVMVNVGSTPPTGVTGFAYGVNKGSPTINIYNVNKDGSLAVNSNTSITDNGYPTNLVTDGKYLYAADSGLTGNPGLSVYTIDTNTGKLTPGSTVSMPFPAQYIVLSGSFLYAAVPANGTIVAFKIVDPSTGIPVQLPPAEGPIVNAGIHPTYLVVNGSFVFSTDNGSNKIYIFQINSSQGNLLPVAGSPFTVGSNPSAIVIGGSSTYAYVANQGDSTISVFQISSTGSLTPISGSPFATRGQSPVALLLSPANNALYVGDEATSKIDEFQVSLVNQVLSVTQFAGSPLTAEGGPVWFTIR